MLAALVALGAALVTQRTDAGPQHRPASSSTRLGSTVVGGISGYVLAAQASGKRIWVDTCVQLCGAADTGLDSERLVEIDAGSGAVIRRLPPLSNAVAFTTAGQSVWVAHPLGGDVTRLNPVSGRITAEVRLRLPTPIARHDRLFLPDDLSYAGGYVWASTARGWIAQIDARTARLVRMLRTPSEDNAPAIDEHSTWVAEELDGVGRLAPGARHIKTHTIMDAGLPLAVYDVLGGGRVVWALAAADTTATRTTTIVLAIDPRTGLVVHRMVVPTAASGAAVAGGALYLADLAHGRIYRVSSDGSLHTLSTSRHDAWLTTSSPGILWAAGGVTPGHEHSWMLRIRLPRA